VGSDCYDAADRLRTLTYPGGEVVTTTYNSQGLAASLVGTNVYVQASHYDAAGRVISRTVGSGAVQWQTQYTYYPWSTANGQGRLHILQSGPLTNTTLLQNLTYTYDAVGNVKTIVDGVNFGQRQCFQYDPLDRLTRATTSADPVQLCTTPPAGAGNYSEGYEYYKGGSLKRKGAADNANDGLYTYDAGHPHAVATYRGNSYGYDAVGNMITRTVSGVTYTLTYNAENRLTQVVSGTLTASYTYDGDGNRVRSVITAGSQVTETHYVGQHYEKTVGSGDTKYYYIAGQLVAFERSAGYGVDWGRRFVFRDHLGSTNVIINGSSGLLLWRDRYLPFGDVRDTYRRDAGFSLQTQYRFTGQRLEQRLGVAEGGLDRGLYFYGARWYDSSLGRFIQADTLVPQPGNPQALNRYSYVFNNPLRYTDPTGHAQACADGDEGGGCGYGGIHDKMRWIKTGSGVYIDLAHFAEALGTAARIYRGIDSGSSFPIERVSTAKLGPINLQAGIRTIYHVQAELTPDQRTGTALGILMDSSYLFETFQALPPSSHSSFSGEDLSSDYLGFYAATTGQSLGQLLTVLGPPKAASANMPKNHQFTPLVQDSAGQWRNSLWPAPLSITPINSAGGMWQRVMAEPVGNAWSGAGDPPRLLGPSNFLGQIHGWTLVP
jgi:RHS repeat-associated protein